MSEQSFPEKVYAGRNSVGELIFSTKPFDGCVEYDLRKDFLFDSPVDYYPIFFD